MARKHNKIAKTNNRTRAVFKVIKLGDIITAHNIYELFNVNGIKTTFRSAYSVSAHMNRFMMEYLERGEDIKGLGKNKNITAKAWKVVKVLK